MKHFCKSIWLIFLLFCAGVSSAQGNITGPINPCLNSKVQYSYCPTQFPYHWRWTTIADSTVRDLGTTSTCYLAEVTIGKSATTLTFHQSNPAGLPQLQNVTKYISPKKCKDESSIVPDARKPVAEIKVNWAEYKANGKHPNQGLLNQLYLKRQELIENKSLGLTTATQLENCSYVYWGCGSCPSGGARVEAYCGSGGSQPDYSWCESC